jgi:hypothetical protein
MVLIKKKQKQRRVDRGTATNRKTLREASIEGTPAPPFSSPPNPPIFFPPNSSPLGGKTRGGRGARALPVSPRPAQRRAGTCFPVEFRVRETLPHGETLAVLEGGRGSQRREQARAFLFPPSRGLTPFSRDDRISARGIRAGR